MHGRQQRRAVAQRARGSRVYRPPSRPRGSQAPPGRTDRRGIPCADQRRARAGNDRGRCAAGARPERTRDPVAAADPRAAGRRAGRARGPDSVADCVDLSVGAQSWLSLSAPNSWGFVRQVWPMCRPTPRGQHRRVSVRTSTGGKRGPQRCTAARHTRSRSAP